MLLTYKEKSLVVMWLRDVSILGAYNHLQKKWGRFGFVEAKWLFSLAPTPLDRTGHHRGGHVADHPQFRRSGRLSKLTARRHNCSPATARGDPCFHPRARALCHQIEGHHDH
jgi:hypothetical protein